MTTARPFLFNTCDFDEQAAIDINSASLHQRSARRPNLAGP